MKKIISLLLFFATAWVPSVYVQEPLIEAEEPVLTQEDFWTGVFSSEMGIVSTLLFLRLLYGSKMSSHETLVTTPASSLQHYLPLESAHMMQSVIKKADLSQDMSVTLTKGGWIHAFIDEIIIDKEQWNAFTLDEQKLVMAHECIHVRDHHPLKYLALMIGTCVLVPLGLYAYDKITFKALNWVKQKCSKNGKCYRMLNSIQKFNHTISSHWLTKSLVSAILFIAHARHCERQADIKAITELGANAAAGLTYRDHIIDRYKSDDNNFFVKLQRSIIDHIGLHPSRAEREQYLKAMSVAT